MFQRYASKKHKGTAVVDQQESKKSKVDKRKSKFMSIFSKRYSASDEETDMGTVRGSNFTGLGSESYNNARKSMYQNTESIYDSRIENITKNFSTNNARITLTGPRELLVFEDYDAEMEDEIICTSGDIIWVEEEFDDGWAMGQNLTTGSSGIFPMAICDEISGNGNNRKSRKSTRQSSLTAGSRF